MKKFFLLFLLLNCYKTTQSQVDYKSTKFQEWKLLFNQGKQEELKEALTTHLKIENNHSLGIYFLASSSIAFKWNISEFNIPNQTKQKLEKYILTEALNQKQYYPKIAQIEYTIENDFFQGGFNYNIASLESINIDRAYKLCKNQLQLSSDEYFVSAWQIENLIAKNKTIRELIKEDINSGFYDRWPNIKTYLQMCIQYYPIGSLSKLDYTLNYLKTHPNDPMAQRYVGKMATTSNLKDLAKSFFLNAIELDPLYNSNYEDLISIYAFQNKEDSLNEVLSKYQFRFNLDSSECYSIKISAYIDANDLGKAYELLISGKNRFSKNKDFIESYLKFMSTAEKYDFNLIPLNEIVQIDDNGLYFSSLLNTYLRKTNQNDLALEILKEEYKKLGFLTNNLYSQLYDLSNKKPNFEIWDNAITNYPDDNWLYARKGIDFYEKGKLEEAYKYFNFSININPDVKWVWQYIYKIANSINSDKIFHEIKLKINNLPCLNSYNEAYVETNNFTINQKISHWESELKDHPGALPAISWLRYLYSERKNWQDGLALFENNEAEIQSTNNRDYLTDFYLEKSYLLTSFSDDNAVDQNWTTEMFKALENYQYNYGDPSVVSFRKTIISEVNPQYFEMKEGYLLEAIRLNPNYKSAYTSLIFSSDKSFSSAYTSYRKFVERNPFDSERLKNFIDFNVKWGGSKIEALDCINKFQELFPNSNEINEVIGYTDMVYGQFGDGIPNYTRYLKKSVIAQSNKYVGWYLSALQKAMNTTVKTIVDLPSRTVKVLAENGEEMSFTEDHYCGKVTRITKGPVEINANYNSNCDLTNVTYSTGVFLSIEYNNIGKVIQMKSQDNLLDFSYNNMNKLETILLNKKSKLEIVYDEEGEILETKSDEGRDMAITIISEMQHLNQMVKDLSKPYKYFYEGDLPDISTEREVYLTFKEKAEKNEIDFKSNLLFSNYLLKNLAYDAEYGIELCELSIKNIELLKKSNTKIKSKYAVPFVNNFYQCLNAIRRRGVAMDYWEQWQKTLEWLISERINEKKKSSYYEEIRLLEELINKSPIKLLNESYWLEKNDLSKSFLWKEINPKSLISLDKSIDIELTSTLLLNDEIKIVGTSKGLLIEKGVWKWYGFDNENKHFIEYPKEDDLKATSHITCLEKINENTFAIGTMDGLLIWDLTTNKIDKFGILQGLESPTIKNIKLQETKDENILWIVTSAGIQPLFINGKLGSIIGEEKLVINDIECYSSTSLLLATNSGIYSLENNILNELTSELSVFIEVFENGDVFTYDGKEITKFNFKSGSSITMLKVEQLSGDFLTTSKNRVYGLEKISIDNFTEGLAVITDFGISIYHQHHFEHLKVPPTSDLATGIKALSGNESSNLALSTNRIWIYEKNNDEHYDFIAKNIICTENGTTFLSTGGTLLIHQPESNGEIKPFIFMDPNYDPTEYYYTTEKETYSTNIVATIRSNEIIFNDDDVIYHGYLKDSIWYAKPLFNIDLTIPEKFPPSSNNSLDAIQSILFTTKEELWVSTDYRLYRYNFIDSTVYTYAYFLNEKQFPVKSNMIGKIFELPDGRIWLVASDNSFQRYKGISMEGGLFEYDRTNDKFIGLQKDEINFNWFITDITPINKDYAILSSTNGFQEYSNGQIQHMYFYQTKAERNPSYDELITKFPALYLGTKGTLYKDIYLFGTPSGIIGWKDEKWVSMEMLNNYLPNFKELNEYGARHIYSISVDKQNLLFVSTTKGTIVKNINDMDPSEFLFQKEEIDQIVNYKQARNLKQQQLVINEIPKTSASGKLLNEYNRNNFEINKVRNLKGNLQLQTLHDPDQKVLNKDSLDQIIQQLDMKNAEILLKIQQNNPAIYNALRIPPLDLLSNRNKLMEDECIIQYVLLKDEILIHFVSKNETELVRLAIPKDSIVNLAKSINSRLKDKISVNLSNSYKNRKFLNGQSLPPTASDYFTNDLKKMYHWLIGPVENKLTKYQNILLAPSEELFNIPYSCLIKEKSEDSNSYLIEDYNLAYLPTMYLFDLVYLLKENNGEKTVLYGDPDGTLPGARAEVKTINELMKDSQLNIGKDASVTNFISGIKSANIVHLATHGKLNSEQIEKSELLLSDGVLTLPMIYGLVKMPNANLAVLSACETGIGSKGIEYSSLALAFSNAGIPRIVSTLWEVDDEASSLLMRQFYSNMSSTDSKLNSFSNAQRMMISNPEYARKPFYWSGYYYIGKP